MITDALDAGAPASWVTGDEVYGHNPQLRAALEQPGIGYVLAVACNRRINSASPSGGPPPSASCPLGLAAANRRSRRKGLALLRLRLGPLRPSTPAGTVSCSSAATVPPANSPTTCARIRPVPLSTLVRVAGIAGARGNLPGRQGSDRP